MAGADEVKRHLEELAGGDGGPLRDFFEAKLRALESAFEAAVVAEDLEVLERLYFSQET